MPKAGGDTNDDALNADSPITLEEAIKLARYVVERYGGDGGGQSKNHTLKQSEEPQPGSTAPIASEELCAEQISNESESEEPSSNEE